MADTSFYVPRLVKEGAWLDWRNRHTGGYEMYGVRDLSGVRYVANHHSVTQPTGNAARDVDTLANIHINGNGWAGIGYNIIVTSEVVNGFAKAAYVGDLATIRAHTPNTKGAFGLTAGYGNQYIIAVCVIGMNHQVMPTVEQLRTLKLINQELLWFEDERLPNLWNTWDDVQPHKVFDWTQCNGLDQIKQAMIDTVIPSDAPASIPVPASIKLAAPIRFTANFDGVNVWDLTSNPNYKGVKTLKKSEEFVAYAKIDFNNSTYYVTEYSHGKGNKHGVNKVDLTEVKPTPQPVEEKPVVRALGLVTKFAVDKDDVLVDIVSGAVKKVYTKREEFVGTHKVTYKGKSYIMTEYSAKRFYDGLANPQGVLESNLDEWIDPLPEVDNELPPHDGEKLPVDPELVRQHDEDIKALDKRLTFLEKVVKTVIDFLESTFRNFKK